MKNRWTFSIIFVIIISSIAAIFLGININFNKNPKTVYAVYLDGNIYGPFSYEQLKSYPLLEDTLITTNTLNGSWYEAMYFECLDDLFRPNLPFRIDADGVIIRTEVGE